MANMIREDDGWNFKLYACEQCGKPFWEPNASKQEGRIDQPLDDTPRGHLGRFCSKACMREYAKAHPNEDLRTGFEKFMCTLRKFACRVGSAFWWCIKQLFANKWVLSIWTCGLSWLLWKGLNKVYGLPKVPEETK